MIKRYLEIIGRKSKKAFENKVKNELKNKVLKGDAIMFNLSDIAIPTRLLPKSIPKLLPIESNRLFKVLF